MAMTFVSLVIDEDFFCSTASPAFVTVISLFCQASCFRVVGHMIRPVSSGSHRPIAAFSFAEKGVLCSEEMLCGKP